MEVRKSEVKCISDILDLKEGYIYECLISEIAIFVDKNQYASCESEWVSFHPSFLGKIILEVGQ